MYRLGRIFMMTSVIELHYILKNKLIQVALADNSRLVSPGFGLKVPLEEAFGREGSCHDS